MLSLDLLFIPLFASFLLLFSKGNASRVLAFIFTLMLTLLASIRAEKLSAYKAPEVSEIGYVQNVGMKLFTDFLLPFEISSVLFVSAMIAAVVLAKKERN